MRRSRPPASSRPRHRRRAPLRLQRRRRSRSGVCCGGSVGVVGAPPLWARAVVVGVVLASNGGRGGADRRGLGWLWWWLEGMGTAGGRDGRTSSFWGLPRGRWRRVVLFVTRGLPVVCDTGPAWLARLVGGQRGADVVMGRLVRRCVVWAA